MTRIGAFVIRIRFRRILCYGELGRLLIIIKAPILYTTQLKVLITGSLEQFTFTRLAHQ